MRINVKRHNNGSIQVCMDGQLMPEDCERLTIVCTNLIARGARSLILDMSEVTYIGATGMNSLLHLYQQARRRGGQLCLRKIPDRFERVFKLSPMARFLPASEAEPSRSGEN